MADRDSPIRNLWERVERLERTVSALESDYETGHRNQEARNSAGSWDTNRWDHYDRAVIDLLETGEEYGRLQIKEMYERNTAIKRPETAKRRAKALYESNLFEKGVFVGADSDAPDT